MSNDHTGLYICLIILIGLVAACLIVLLYNAGARLPDIEASYWDAWKNMFTPEQKATLGSYGLILLIVLIGTPVIMFFCALLSTYYSNRASNSDNKTKGDNQ